MSLTEILATRPGYIQQPGPAGAAYTSAATRLIELDFELPAGVSLHDALAQEIKSRGLSGAYVRITNAGMSKMEYVIPALSPDDDHAAWYSETRKPPMPGRIEDAGIVCGWLNDKVFYHCHGLWSDANGDMAAGHLLPDASVFSVPTRVVGFGFRDARFNRVSDSQTGFDLFVPEQLATAPRDAQAILLRITPNIEISQPLIEACQKDGWTHASVHGIGSTIGAAFTDGRVMNSFATEFLITKGTVNLSGPTPVCDLDIVIVGLDGNFMQGRLKPLENPVLMTSELILKNQSEDQGHK
jgi:predicted DNA-binding protein with PD1-like motif